MDLVFYIFWRAFNTGKQKGLFIENIALLVAAELLAIVGCFLILVDGVFKLGVRERLPNIRSSNLTERYLAIIIALVLFAVIYTTLKSYFKNHQKRIITEKSKEFKSAKPSTFIFLFIIITFSSFFSLWVAGIILR